MRGSTAELVFCLGCCVYMSLLLGVEVCQCCSVVVLVAGTTQLELESRCAGVCGHQGLKVSLSGLLLHVQSLESLERFLRDKCALIARDEDDPTVVM